MKSKRVTQAWEFYRDNCLGYKEPMRREFRKLDEHVSSVEAENAKLRELVDELYPLADYGAIDASELDRAHDLMRELGIEVTP